VGHFERRARAVADSGLHAMIGPAPSGAPSAPPQWGGATSVAHALEIAFPC
jgi:hypothetical protein